MLKILVDEKNKGTSKYNWISIAKVFSAQVGTEINEKQARNHFSDSKEKFKSWEELQNLTGIAYDPRTKKVDVQEESLERYKAYLERNVKYGKKIIRNGLPNIDLLIQLFDGKTAHGVGGCFSPAMGKGPSYLTDNLNALNIDESSGDNEDEENSDQPDLSLSGNESRSPPRLVVQKVSNKMSHKRKSGESCYSIENKRRQASFDSVI
ncbi:uncharacterized protein LOC141609293 [Silene latifolia]|uniref:uncharacterized protein LOC141609293 n=1 Tax=Silene latifolia TaxID=37657 RepID=UPI003D78A665